LYYNIDTTGIVTIISTESWYYKIKVYPKG